MELHINMDAWKGSKNFNISNMEITFVVLDEEDEIENV